MLKVTDEIKGLDMTFQPTDQDIAMIASAVKQDWFNLLQRLMENEVKLLNVALINTSTSNPSEILANHAVAKGAGMFYVGFIQRIQQLLAEAKYTSEGIGTLENPEKPPYVAEFEFDPTTVDPNDQVS
jgi:hypothetical protein